MINLGRGAQGEVLNEKEIDFVPVHIVLRRLAEVAHDQGAQTAFAGVQRGGLQELAQLVDLDLLIHGVQPGLHLLGKLFLGLFLQNALILGKRNFDLQVLGERDVNGEDGTSFFPLRQPSAVGSWGGGQIQSCDCFVHGCIIHSQGQSRNRTATALLPS